MSIIEAPPSERPTIDLEEVRTEIITGLLPFYVGLASGISIGSSHPDLFRKLANRGITISQIALPPNFADFSVPENTKPVDVVLHMDLVHVLSYEYMYRIMQETQRILRSSGRVVVSAPTKYRPVNQPQMSPYKVLTNDLVHPLTSFGFTLDYLVGIGDYGVRMVNTRIAPGDHQQKISARNRKFICAPNQADFLIVIAKKPILPPVSLPMTS